MVFLVGLLECGVFSGISHICPSLTIGKWTSGILSRGVFSGINHLMRIQVEYFPQSILTDDHDLDLDPIRSTI